MNGSADVERKPQSTTDWRRRLLIGCSALTALLWLIQFTPYLNVADDSGRYMVLGESIARTGDLRLINQVHRPLDTLYPPGFPCIISFWLLVTGREPAGVVLPVKATLLLLLIGTFPMLLRLLEKSRLSRGSIVAVLVAYAACPATVGYANEVMSEIPLLFLCLLSVVLVERSAKEISDAEEPAPLPSTGRRLLALLCAAAAFLVRTSGIALLLAQTVWFWRRFGWRWGMAASLTLLCVVGGWLGRNRHIIKTHPKIHYSTYVDQFTLRDPARLNAGRIPLSPLGLLSRIKSGFPTYLGLIPRAPLYMMGPPHSGQLLLFYLVAPPLALLILAGAARAWYMGLKLSSGFSALFWLVAALWPWQSARFIVPLVPFMLLYAGIAAQYGLDWLARHMNQGISRTFAWVMSFALFFYYAIVHNRLIHENRRPTAPGYNLGRNREEGGFYAACGWLRANVGSNALVMGKPPYLLHLYSGCLTTQIEPSLNPRVQEKAYIVPQHVAYLLEDAWSFGFVTHRLLAPYLRVYGDRWTLAWQDRQGSGVRIWRRLPAADPLVR